MKLITMLCPVTLVAAFGCAATGPTPELMDARRAYDEARQSEAANYSPDKLLTAKQALEKAESAHADDAGSFEERSLAYVAQRKAQYAAVYGLYEKDRRDEAQAQQAYKDKQDSLRRNAVQQATDAQKSLAATWDNLSNARKEIAAQQTQIQKSRAELDAEKEARAKAEQSAAAAMASLSKIAQVKEEQRGVVITLDGQVLFVTGKAELLPIARDRLNQVAKSLKELDDDKLVSIEGFTDSRGSDDTNLKLSQDRANTVREYLASQGVKPEKLRAVGRGEASPVASNETPEGRANNRRVEIVIQSSAQAAAGMSTTRP
ncbi:MAG TPA: OmpA family protein [Polyangiaceae bacterium]|nr:OmpA family protein [Polyangiaceae bacterium]